MSIYISIFINSLIIGFSGAIMPGPMLTATIGESTRRGAIAGPLFSAGHALLELLLLILLFLGLSPFLKMDLVFVIISISGAFIMSFMAFQMFRSVPVLKLSDELNKKSKGSKFAFLTGAIMSLSNPYWIIWWATIGLALTLDSWKHGFLGILVFFIGHILSDFIWFSFISVTISKGKKFMSDKIYKGLITVCAVLLSGFSVWFLYSGINKLLILKF